MKFNWKKWIHTKWSNASEGKESSNLSPKALKISDEAMIEVLIKALLGFFIAFTITTTTFSLFTPSILANPISTTEKWIPYAMTHAFAYLALKGKKQNEEKYLTRAEAREWNDTVQTAWHYSVTRRLLSNPLNLALQSSSAFPNQMLHNTKKRLNNKRVS